MSATAHHFKFSRDFRGSDRVCGECRRTYDEGEHILIDKLKPYSRYVCPNGAGKLGHRSIYTGEYRPVLRTLRDHICTCGAELVEEDNETWRLTWEMQTPLSPDWREHTNVQSRHAAHSQHAGLLHLIEQGESATCASRKSKSAKSKSTRADRSRTPGLRPRPL